MTKARTIDVVTSRRTVRCGPLRREPDGSWFHGAAFLGQDDDPQQAICERDELAGWTAEKLAEALENASIELRKGGEDDEMCHALSVLRRYDRWQATGRW